MGWRFFPSLLYILTKKKEIADIKNCKLQNVSSNKEPNGSQDSNFHLKI
jgi:hypothetical protein